VVVVAGLLVVTRPTGDSPGTAPTVNVDWATYLGNLQRTQSTTNESWLTTANAAQLGINWSFTTGDQIASQTIVLDGVAYFGSWDGYEYAVNVTSGSLLWKTFLGRDPYDPSCGTVGITSAPTVGGGMLYVGGNNASGGADATWYALDAATGAISWSIPIGNMSVGYYNWASPLIHGGYAYVGVSSDCDKPMVPAGLLQVNLASHAVQNFFHTTPFNTSTDQYEVGASIWATPSIDVATNTVFVATGNPGPDTISTLLVEPLADSVIALNASNISRNAAGGPGPEASWQVPYPPAVIDGDFGAGATILPGVGPAGQTIIVAGDKDGWEYAWNATNLSSWTVAPGHLGTLWEVDMNTTQVELVTPASYGGGLIYFGTGPLHLDGADYNGSVWAVNPTTGQVVWNDALGGREIGAPLYASGVLIVPGGNYLYVLNASTGLQIADWVYPASFVDAPSLAEGHVFEGNYDDEVYAICLNSPGCRTYPQP
jgi:outer membrane protein assembly factor BamB